MSSDAAPRTTPSPDMQPGVSREGLLNPEVRGYDAPVGSKGGGRRRKGRRGDKNAVVPDVEFTSYYGRPVVKESPWTSDIPAYLFLGGLAAGSSLLGVGAARTGLPTLRRNSRITALAAISGSFYFLVHDLGRPARFINMLRVAKPTSPMSMGTWALVGYGPAAGLAGGVEILRMLPPRGPIPLLSKLLTPFTGLAGIGAALIAPVVASYTGVLLGDTATPTWFQARRELPLLFAASAGTAAGGFAAALSPPAEAAPARRLAIAGAAADLLAQKAMERRLGDMDETIRTGVAGRWHRPGQLLTVAGALLTFAGRWSRLAAVIGGLSLTAGSVCTRFSVFEAGQASTRDPRWTVVHQRRRVEEGRAGRAD